MIYGVYQQTFYDWNGTQSSKDYVGTVDDSQNLQSQFLAWFGTSERKAVVFDTSQQAQGVVTATVKWSPINKAGYALDREAPGDYRVVFTGIAQG